MYSVGVISYVKKLVLRFFYRTPWKRSRWLRGYCVHSPHGGHLRAWALTGPCASCLFLLLRSRRAFQAMFLSFFFFFYTTILLFNSSATVGREESQFPSIQFCCLLVTHQWHAWTWKLCLMKETYPFLYSTLLLCFSTLLTCRQRGQCLFFLKKV